MSGVVLNLRRAEGFEQHLAGIVGLNFLAACGEQCAAGQGQVLEFEFDVGLIHASEDVSGRLERMIGFFGLVVLQHGFAQVQGVDGVVMSVLQVQSSGLGRLQRLENILVMVVRVPAGHAELHLGLQAIVVAGQALGLLEVLAGQVDGVGRVHENAGKTELGVQLQFGLLMSDGQGNNVFEVFDAVFMTVLAVSVVGADQVNVGLQHVVQVLECGVFEHWVKLLMLFGAGAGDLRLDRVEVVEHFEHPVLVVAGCFRCDQQRKFGKAWAEDAVLRLEGVWLCQQDGFAGLFVVVVVVGEYRPKLVIEHLPSAVEVLILDRLERDLCRFGFLMCLVDQPEHGGSGFKTLELGAGQVFYRGQWMSKVDVGVGGPEAVSGCEWMLLRVPEHPREVGMCNQVGDSFSRKPERCWLGWSCAWFSFRLSHH